MQSLRLPLRGGAAAAPRHALMSLRSRQLLAAARLQPAACSAGSRASRRLALRASAVPPRRVARPATPPVTRRGRPLARRLARSAGGDAADELDPSAADMLFEEEDGEEPLEEEFEEEEAAEGEEVFDDATFAAAGAQPGEEEEAEEGGEGEEGFEELRVYLLRCERAHTRAHALLVATTRARLRRGVR
jgi:hypothetical protein